MSEGVSPAFESNELCSLDIQLHKIEVAKPMFIEEAIDARRLYHHSTDLRQIAGDGEPVHEHVISRKERARIREVRDMQRHRCLLACERQRVVSHPWSRGFRY